MKILLLIISILIPTLTFAVDTSDAKAEFEKAVKDESWKDKTKTQNKAEGEKRVTQKDLENLGERIALKPLTQGDALKVIQGLAKNLVEQGLSGITEKDVVREIVENILSKKDEAAGVLRYELSVPAQEALLKFSKTEAAKEWFEKAGSISQESSKIVMEALQSSMDVIEKKYNAKSKSEDKKEADKPASEESKKDDVEKTQKEKDLEKIAAATVLDSLKTGPTRKVIDQISKELVREKDLKGITSKEVSNKLLDAILDKKQQIVDLFKVLSDKTADGLMSFFKTEGKEWFEKVGSVSNACSIIVMDAIQESVMKLEEKYGSLKNKKKADVPSDKKEPAGSAK